MILKYEDMLVAVLSGFILAICLIFFGKFLRGKWSILLSALPILLFIYFLSQITSVSGNGSIMEKNNWAPSFGVNLDFYLDGLALLFALLITGIGSLVFIYTSSYLKGHQYLDRFFGYLCMFMSSMLGLVLSANTITLFIFWELTSISSFFLIGFYNEDKASRSSSLIALSITGFGGFFLLIAASTLGHIGNSYDITQLFYISEDIKTHSLYGWLILFLFIAAFTKSAQFPFHFWLPGAMTAPAPVSTYLHSATMVKAGVYLLARFSPILGGTFLWDWTLVLVGGFTLLYAASYAVFRTDLKEILAYSTVSVLGLLVFLIGIGTQQAMLALTVFIISHALYKAGLFLITGIIEHQTGKRSILQLSGLRKAMLPVAIAGFLAALISAGFPPTFGFFGKDLVYEATLTSGKLPFILTTVAITGNILLLLAGFLAGINPFVNQLPLGLEKVHLPSPLMWGPPLLLTFLGVLFGIFPGLIESKLLYPVVTSLLQSMPDFHLTLWHGPNLVLLLSIFTIGFGTATFLIFKPSGSLSSKIGALKGFAPKFVFIRLIKAFKKSSYFLTRWLQNGHLRNYLFTIVSFLTVLLAFRLFSEINSNYDLKSIFTISIYEVVIFVIVITAIIFTVFSTSRLVAVVSLGAVGYSICLIFLFYSAPDLAMTQFSIDTLTVVLFVLVISGLPKYLNTPTNKVRFRDGILSGAFGLLIALLALEVLHNSVNKDISTFYAENAYVMAHGKNVVNVILVDFRGFDTMVEITVLTIAALGVYGLLKLRVKHQEN